MAGHMNIVTISPIDDKNIAAGQPQRPPIGFIPPNVISQQFEPPLRPPPYEPPPPYNPTYQPTQTATHHVGSPTVTNWQPYSTGTLQNACGTGVIVFMIILFCTGIGAMVIIHNRVQERMSEDWSHHMTIDHSLQNPSFKFTF